MADSKIGAAFIEVAVKGLMKVQSDLAQIKNRITDTASSGKKLDDATRKSGEAAGEAKKSFQGLSDTINTIGSIATKTFFGSIGAITGFVRAASPKEFEDFQFALTAVAIQLGRIFLPLLREATEWLMRLRDFFQGLSDEQRENILRWVKIGLGIAGVLMLLPRLVAAFRVVRIAMAMLSASTGIASGGITLLLGAIAAAIPLLIALFGSMDGGGGLGGVFAPIGEALQTLWGEVQRIFTQIGQFIAQVVRRILEAFSRVLPPIIRLISTVINTVASVLFPVLESITNVVGQVIDAVVPIIDAVVEVFNEVVEAIQPVIETITEALRPAFQILTEVVRTVVGILSSVFRALMAAIRPVISVIVSILRPVIQGLASVMEMIGNTIIDVLNGIISAINSVLEYVPGTDYIGGSRDFQLQHFGHRRREERNEDRQPGDTGGGRPVPHRERRETDPNRFRGEVRQQAVAMIGIADLWKKIQGAQAEDLQSRIQREQLEESRRGNRHLRDIADNTRPRNDWEGAGGEW